MEALNVNMRMMKCILIFAIFTPDLQDRWEILSILYRSQCMCLQNLKSLGYL